MSRRLPDWIGAGLQKLRGAAAFLLRPLTLAIFALILLGVGSVASWQDAVLASPPKPESSGLHFVGTETCAGCHEAAGTAWAPSQHAHAMDHATDATVLGDFDDASFDYFGTTSRFFKKDGKFFVETDGRDGKLGTFEVKYTFGLDPLQQYLVAFPDGRIQALPLAWDSRPKAEGGQRWFHLYPDEHIDHADQLHWTKLEQNWNFMCAECHSTGVKKNYDSNTDRFATSWKEISVGCEACHGKGSGHVAWAKGEGDRDDPKKGLVALFDERDGVSWHQDPETGLPVRSKPPKPLRVEVETCGRCHALRSQISEDWEPGQPLSDTHLANLISEGAFQADGQMEGEVFNYGSFKQSKMFAAGVTCSDCHEPHSGHLRAKGEAVCLQCHSADLATKSHTHHSQVVASERPDCISCHMPAHTFMVIDERHDHSFRIPRPDLSVELGTSNACNDCHQDKSPAWAATAIEEWFGPERKGFQTYGAAFHHLWEGKPGAADELAAVARDGTLPGFVRGSALAALPPPLTEKTFQAAQAALSDPDPIVRLGALESLSTLPPDQAWPVVSPLLDDPVRSVRMRAGELLAGAPLDALSRRQKDALKRAQEAFVAAQNLNADRPESRGRLADFYVRQGRLDEAEQEYEAALRLNPAYGTAAVNLADLYRRQGQDEKGAEVLRKAIEAAPEEGAIYHALGLTLVRLKQQEEALEALKKAAELAPDRPRFAYVYAVGLNSMGRKQEAMTVLEESLERHPHDRETLMMLLNFASETGQMDKALVYAERLAEIDPDNQELQTLIQALKARSR
ncbi:TPR repeat-containing protein YrrB [Methyloligella halotolerans]|uniref:TPR repeat-containing protein YrrB n=1 Tax=Methyloligella halotolerans TaxID=1177755 RepID=A0A1E2RWD3_9HYPH|nr:TPR repeat-containing protein YrrB [Methyloligella halotolerans]